MTRKIRMRRGTAAQWATADPILADGEMGWITDVGTMRVGDGVTPWSGLADVMPELRPGVGTTLDVSVPGEVRVDLDQIVTEVWDTPGTYDFDLPVDAKLVTVIAFGGGGGGAGGWRKAEGAERRAAGGGGAGGASIVTVPASTFVGTQTVTVGAGGAGGAGAVSDGQGENGTDGGNSAFGWVTVGGGGSGYSTGLLPGLGGEPGHGNLRAGRGGSWVDETVPLALFGQLNGAHGAAGSGGAGMARTAGDTDQAPGLGGKGTQTESAAWGADGADGSIHGLGGGGGGGGLASGKGGDGGWPGGGGGGGGRSITDPAGAGGSGGDGLVVVHITRGI